MKKRQIKVGDKSSKRQQIQVTVNSAENVADALKLSGGNEAALAALFNRGLDIWRQDRIARSMFADGESVAAIEKAIAEAVPGVTKGRGRPAKPKVVTLPKDWAKLPREKQIEYLKAQGLTVVEAE